MARRRKVLLLVGGGAVALLLFALSWPQPDFIYQARSVNAWIRQLEGTATGKASEAAEAERVLIELGARGLPLIVQELNRTRPTSLLNRWPYVSLWELYPRTRKFIRSPRNFEDMAVREGLYKVLGALGSNAAPAVPALRVGLKDTWNRHYLHAIDALGQIGPAAKDAQPDLLERLESNSLETQEAAAKALARMGYSDGRTALLLNNLRPRINSSGENIPTLPP